MKEQTEKQKYSKSPLYGYQKPEREEINGPLWCRCKIPTLVHSLGIGPGMAECRRCGCPYYH